MQWLAWIGAALIAGPALAAPQVLAEYPGAFLENLTRTTDGHFVVTSYADSRLLVGTGQGGFVEFARLPAHPAGIAATPTGFVVTAHGGSFFDGPGFVTTNRILMLDTAGRVVRDIAVPDARFLNGIVADGDGWLIADSIAATIWRFDPASGVVTRWLSGERLAGDIAKGGKPGANGLKRYDGALYVSNSARGTIDRVALDAGGRPSGDPQPFATPGAADDFAFAGDGTAYFATHGATLLAITPAGAVRTILAEGCESCTAVAVDGDGLIVLTTGNRFEGGKLPARILRVKP